ncbi:allophanate hydrolase [Microbacterium rhizomatis]|uniref:Allophanate hydrolase n=1 Tax=Microbacterium rhizomatis TaxID=1631477 RepID=A0A5J5IZD6_9MICO|nr:allophanate hydrolase [Microbacterium rhizomatis]KAA9106043.1 allophanate hydrolase [Microbacterium rhizomatis]
MSAREKVTAAYRSIRAADRPEVWISLREEEDVLREADRIDDLVNEGERLPLAGVIVAVKDNIDVAGLQTTAGAPSYAYLPAADATAVSRLRTAGAIVIGKTNLDQFATGLVGVRSPYGAVRNSVDPSRISGGSSSGSAVAVALGLVDLALGTDTAGSGRVPAALNGIWGFKPTRGRVPATGVVPACRTLDCVTVFAREPRLGRHAVDVMAGPDGNDPLAGLRVAPASTRPIRRVLIPTVDEYADIAPGWGDAFQSVISDLQVQGVEVVERSIEPLLAAASLLYGGAFVAERYSAVGAHIAENQALIGTDLDKSVARIILDGANPTASALFDDMERLDRLRLRATELLADADADAILTPTTTWHPTIEQVRADPIAANSRMGRFTNYANLMDMASLAVPAGTVDGLPFGVMFTGPAFSDDQLAEVAGLIGAEHVDVALFGAHMSGGPLNYQITQLGASFRGSVRTSSTYRLYALDTDPPKPGLVHVGAGEPGYPIEGELWSMPADGLGRFLDSLPRPMALGKIRTDDGELITGFLVEPEALENSLDISSYGGWTNWQRAQATDTRQDAIPL